MRLRRLILLFSTILCICGCSGGCSDWEYPNKQYIMDCCKPVKFKGHEYLMNSAYCTVHDPDCKLCFKMEVDRDMAILIMIDKIVHSKKAGRETISIADQAQEK